VRTRRANISWVKPSAGEYPAERPAWHSEFRTRYDASRTQGIHNDKGINFLPCAEARAGNYANFDAPEAARQALSAAVQRRWPILAAACRAAAADLGAPIEPVEAVAAAGYTGLLYLSWGRG
jgi:hypothetical protein